MKKGKNVFFRLLTRFSASGKIYKPFRDSDADRPLRAELFSIEQLEQHAAEIARKHRVSPERGRDRLLGRLSGNERVLLEAHRLIATAVAREQEISPADEWFLDNFYLIKEQIRAVRQHLPKGYSRELPRLFTGQMAGYPRVYDIVLDLVSHVDGQVSPESFAGFIKGYQTVTPLSMGELWATPIMLRLALIENLRRIMARIIVNRGDWDKANDWVNRLLETAERQPGNLILLMADMARAHKSMRNSFIAEFARRLQNQGPVFAFTLTWIEQRLGEKGLTIEQVVQDENRQQAADQVSVSNSITSMRFVDETDWHAFIENVSIVEHILGDDPSGTYAHMDFTSRDRYRHVIEDIARQSDLTEIEVARTAVRLTREKAAGKEPGSPAAAHVGYYLVDKGLPDLEQAAGVRLPFFRKFRKMCGDTFRNCPLVFYLGTIFFLTALGTGALLISCYRYGIFTPAVIAFCLVTFLSVGQLAVELVNRAVTLTVRPRYLPRMDFFEGIPSSARTLVVIPTLLINRRDIENLLNQLEIRYLGNRDAHLHFALLTDFCDAPREAMPDDETLLTVARDGIRALNDKYGHERTDIFFLFHRPRRLNTQERIWMGHERKRGKLADLNAFLRGKTEDRFSDIVGDTRALQKVKYVLTLDTDTQLFHGSARQLVSVAEHPLNRPQYDEQKERVCKGYGIFQPRVGVNLLSANRSRFSQIFSGDPRFDPYTRAISDVYQDLFNEGSFIGKGLYDVDIFNRVLEGRFPANRILSHDLLEGCYARTALVSDVLICEDFPVMYGADVSRRHRWIRGDWQIAAWLFPYVPGPGGSRLKNPLSALSRWKIFDNLRRSLAPPALTLMLLLGWLVMGPVWLWTAVGAGIILGPSLLSAAAEFIRKTRGLTFRFRLRETSRSAGRYFVQTVFTLIFLPYEAYANLDAVLRTMVRLLFTRRGLLRWTAAKSAERKALKNQGSCWQKMWIAPLTAVCVTGYLAGFTSGIHPAPLAIIIPWFFSPLLAWWISLPLIRRETVLSRRQAAFLRILARKTWLFFETFNGAESNWLPPDNYQEHPLTRVAFRTSPTNIGFSLAANLAAYDFGYLSTGGLLERTEKTLAAMKQLDRFHGHFYNWYDIQTLKPLPPLYISAVDSGNLQCLLLILRQGLLELPDRDILPSPMFDGIADSLDLFLDAATPAPKQSRTDGDRSANPPADALRQLSEIRNKMGEVPRTPGLIKELLSRIVSELRSVVGVLSPPDDSEVFLWARTAEKLCASFLEELSFLTPWAEMFPIAEFRPDGLTPNDAAELKATLARLENIPTLRDVIRTGSAALLVLDRVSDASETAEAGEKKTLLLRRGLTDAVARAQERVENIETLALQCDDFADMNYDFLYNKSRQLLAVGFNVGEHRRDESHYDLLASEARLASFILISQGRLPLKHWFSLGRLVTAFRGEPALLSWSGSLFEYLMPLLVMPDYENTLLNQTYRTVVAWQIKYGADHRIPWGFSESGYNSIDAHKNYLYAAFGLPGLGFKRGLSENLVVAPYASALALMVDPENACQNLERMSREGSAGKYGLYEAVDYTRARLAHGESKAVVRSFMIHHQGMTLLAIAYALLNRPMQRRFGRDAAFRAAEPLLQEKVPDARPFFPGLSDELEIRREPGEHNALMRIFTSPNTPVPEVHLMSNGRYHVMVTNAGGGYSRWKDIAITRWREDATCDNMGIFCYIRDMSTGELWSVSSQPALRSSKFYEAIFSQSRAEFRCQDDRFHLHTEIAVSPEEDVELRRVNITNNTWKRHTVELTSYAEVVLASQDAEATHPVFNGLFLETEILRERQAVLCTRRPRSDKETPIWLTHLVTVHNAFRGDVSYETDRARFIGRGRTLRNPGSVNNGGKLSDSEGSVLDPVVAIRTTITIEPEQTAVVDLVFGIAQTRDDAVTLAGKYHDKYFADRIFALAWTHSQVVLHQLGITEPDAQLFGRLAGALLYAGIFRRAAPGLLAKNRRSQSGLWGYGISGDLPIVLLKIGDESKIELVKQLLDAHAYWRLKGLSVDFLIWNEDQSGYRQMLHDRIISLVTAGTKAALVDVSGGVFVRRGDQISDEDKILMQAAARIIITDIGSLEEQMKRRGYPELNIPDLKPANISAPELSNTEKIPARDLIFNNGVGGFTHDGREYVITTTPFLQTPVPWINVLANPSFGTVISESGTAYTWSENAHEFRLTPWYNDPVTDRGGEAFYIRDEETGQFWSAAPLPARGKMPYVSRHGFGYSVFEYSDQGISSEMWTYVATDASVKFVSIKVRNKSNRKRKISVTGYLEPVLGQFREKSQMHIVSGIDPESRSFFVRNPFSIDFPNRIFFFDVNGAERSVTGDRTEFIGRNGSLANPAAMRRTKLSGRTGAGLDPCAALQVQIELPEEEEQEVVFFLGAEKNAEDARNLVRRFRKPGSARRALEQVWGYWNRILGAVNVETPDPKINILVNGWLLYQTLACRIWARSGFYQSSGAIGFRDQLQDMMSVVHAEPALFREHILLCASRQFREGDVQHWWHPPTGRGVRTRISDDYLWLPFTVSYYVKRTGDRGVLDEPVRFLQGRPLNANETDYYDLFGRTDESGTVYEHCVRAINNGLKYGQHGLPLIGSGDWNDSLNQVGEGGSGESVWLGFFLYDVLMQFSALAREYADPVFAQRCLAEAARLKKNIDRYAWDGQWYRRAYFDNGDPLGSAVNDECRIDSISQSWSVLSGAGDARRSRAAMESVKQFLVQRDAGLILLLAPPFNASLMKPGYIKGYLPGVRENGGQYTHAAIWVIMAFAEMGEKQLAWELLQMINPITHGKTPQDIQTYKVEPYVVAADVYSVPTLNGRGGWTWYTGSSGWMYRLIVESLMGLNRSGDVLRFAPRLPDHWNSFKIHYRYQETVYHITLVKTGSGGQVKSVRVDGVEQGDKSIHLADDRREHTAEITIG
ncbi:MAG: glucoamylase family protein [Candidatus Omnitrophota bacterium]